MVCLLAFTPDDYPMSIKWRNDDEVLSKVAGKSK